MLLQQKIECEMETIDQDDNLAIGIPMTHFLSKNMVHFTKRMNLIELFGMNNSLISILISLNVLGTIFAILSRKSSSLFWTSI